MAELSLPYFREVNVKFTAIQSEIINDRKNNLYVPASAGTGKTTVMINRIVDLICDGTVSVNNLLIITFTNAAASEMAERLENKLTERAAINTELYSILADLPSVAIGTLDGFFNRLVKEFFYIVNIDPTYRLMDEAEANALRKRVLKDVLESFYEKGDESFFRLLQIFGRNSNEGLLIMVDKLSHIIENIPDVDNWLKEAENEDKLYEAACFGMGNYIKDYCSGIAKEIKELITEAKYNDCEKKVIDEMETFFSSIIFPENINEIYQINDYLKESINLSITARGLDINSKTYYYKFKEYYDNLRKKLSDISEYINDKNEDKNNYHDGSDLRHSVISILKEFRKKLFEEKVRANTLEFNDVERLGLNVLDNEMTLKYLRNKYKYIFVDEYQDINDLQDRFITKLCGDNKFFAVGDIKQSIYGFRMSEPQNFLDKINAVRNEQQNGKVLPLTENFRSDKNILEFVNNVMKTNMSEKFGRAEYNSDAILNGNISCISTEPAVKISYLKALENEEADEEINEENDEEYGESEAIVSPKKIIPTDLGTVNEIKKLVGLSYKVGDTEKILSYKDIAILCRNKSRLESLYSVLNKHNIPVNVCYDKDVFSGIEIRGIITLCKALNDPYDDISLYGTLTGLFAEFTDSQIADLRAENIVKHNGEKIPFRDFFNETPAFDEFRQSFERYKKLSDLYCAYDFLNIITKETDYIGKLYTLNNGKVRADIFNCFMNSIRVRPQCRSISGLIRFTEDSKLKLETSMLCDRDSVSLMTIHASKGLEYPVVILPGLDTRFRNDNDIISIDRNLGVATENYDFKNKIRSKNIVKEYFTKKKQLKNGEEELRLLYVAITRAKYFLRIIAKDKKRSFIQPSEATDAMAWINNMLIKNPTATTIVKYEAVEMPLNNEADAITEPVFPYNEEIAKKAQEQIDAYNWKYPYENELNVPRKYTSSKLMEDDDEDNYATEIIPDDIFDEKDEAEEKANELRAEKGSMYHKIMELIDFDADSNGVDRIIQEVKDSNEFSLEALSEINNKMIYKAISNKLFHKLIDDKKLYREKSFSVLMPIRELTGKNIDLDVNLQGKLDLLAIGENEAIIIDYKILSSTHFIEDNYSSQLNSYRNAIRRILKIDNVKAYVFALKQNTIIEIKEENNEGKYSTCGA